MEQGKRVREVRKTLNLTLEKFGEKVGVTKQTVSRIENGVNNLTDQMCKSICREFNINEEWLRNGEGEMFLDPDEDVMKTIERIMAGENEFHKNLFKTFAKLSTENLLALEQILDKFVNIESKTPATSPNMTVAEAEAEYIKSRSAFVKKKDLSVLSSTEDAGSNNGTIPNASNQ